MANAGARGYNVSLGAVRSTRRGPGADQLISGQGFRPTEAESLAPDPTGELTALPIPPNCLTGFEGVLPLREWKAMGGKKRERGGEGEGRKRRGCVMAFGGWTPLFVNFVIIYRKLSDRENGV